MQDLSKLLEYAVEQRDKAVSNNTLYTVTYWNGYIDAINKIMEEDTTEAADMIKLGDIITAKSNIGEIATGMVIAIDNSRTSGIPSVLVRTKRKESLWCYLSDNPELKVPKVFEEMPKREEEE